MAKEMTARGVGLRFTSISLAYLMIVLAINYLVFPSLTFEIYHWYVNVGVGVALMAIGLPVFILPGLKIDRYFNEGRLCRTGVYSRMRHPIYGAWILFLTPGLVILLGQLLALTTPIFMYVVFRYLIVEEERYLEDRFGDEYRDYRRSVNALLPRIFT